jgi:hypothetical protein
MSKADLRRGPEADPEAVTRAPSSGLHCDRTAADPIRLGWHRCNSVKIGDSWVITVQCDNLGVTTDFCQIYEDTGPDTELVVVNGTAFPDWIGFIATSGTKNMNSFVGSGGPELTVEAHGFGGHDILVGAGTNDGVNYQERLIGGDDPDHLIGNAGPDLLRGGGGPDVLTGGNGPDILEGGPDRDLMLGDLEADSLSGEGGDDTMCGAGLNTALRPLDGKFVTTIYTGSETADWTSWTTSNTCKTSDSDDSTTFEVFEGGAGNDHMRAEGYKVRMRGGTGQDDATGTVHPDVFCDPNNETDIFRGLGGGDGYYVTSSINGVGEWDNTGGSSSDPCLQRPSFDITATNCTATQATVSDTCPF